MFRTLRHCRQDTLHMYNVYIHKYNNIYLQQKTMLAGLPEGTPLVKQRISELKNEWKIEIKYPEDMDTG